MNKNTWFVIAAALGAGFGIAYLLLSFMGIGGAQGDGNINETFAVEGQEVPVLPLDVVTESEAVALDITDTTARVNFIGTEPLACYLVYGTDETFGDVTNDPQMAQAAIIEHNPIMTGLEPDTEYFYRMQGVGEDGVVYISDVYSFRTLPEQAGDTDNLLSPDNGASILEYSSIFGDGPEDGRWGILNAVDGNTATEWSSNGDGDDAYFIVELAQPSQITELVYQTRSMSDGTAITESFSVTNDAGDTFGPFDVDTTERSITFEVDISTSTLRFDVESSTGGNTGIVDVAAYGEPIE